MGTTKTYFDRPSLWVVIITAILILIIVTIGVLAHIFLDELSARITLISLIIILSILGLCSLAYLEVRKRRVQKLDQNAKNGYVYNKFEPSAPRESDWVYSNRTTLQA